jgi:hypothetical protein
MMSARDCTYPHIVVLDVTRLAAAARYALGHNHPLRRGIENVVSGDPPSATAVHHLYRLLSTRRERGDRSLAKLLLKFDAVRADF